MRLSTRARYGLRAILQLAQSFDKGPVLTRTIAQDQDISVKYLHALLTTLKDAGLVRSVRGPSGGYTLARRPSKIRVSEVVRALEGSLSLIECVEDRAVCKRVDRFAARDIWRDLSKAIEGALSSLTLGDVVARMEKAKTAPPMYDI
jgi:Rrf2 family protein